MPSDYFVSQADCPFCHTHHEKVLAYSRITDEPSGHSFHVGDAVEITREDLAVNDSYLPVMPLDPRGPLHLLETWECSTCRRPRWLEVVIGADNVVQNVEPVALTPEVLDRTHFIGRMNLREQFEGWTGVPLYPHNSFLEPYRPDFVALLRAHLAEHPE